MAFESEDLIAFCDREDGTPIFVFIFLKITTSYDYFAPLSEAADITDKYLAIRDWIKTIENWPNPPKSIPKNNPYVSS